MAALNIVKTLTIRSKVEDADKTKADLKGIQSAYEGVARTTETSARGQLSLTDAVAKQERRLNSTLRAQQDFEKVQRQMNLAIAQNPALQERATAVIELARQRMLAATAANDNFARGTRAAFQTVQSEAQALAGRLGVLGSALSALGPAGLALAAFGGVAAIALHQAADAALKLADRAGKLKDFAETTGFTVIELQALEKAGSQVGVTGEAVSRGLERFSVQMAEVKLRTGETYEKLLAINPEMARHVATAGSLQRAYELVSKAIKDAPLEQANQLARAFFGRSGIEQTRLMRVVAEAGGLKGVIAELHEADIITAKQAERWDTLGDAIAKNMKDAKQNIASIFTESMLEGMERFSISFRDFSREVKQFGINEDLKKFMEFFADPAVRATIAGALAGGLIAGPGGALVGASVGAIAGGQLREADANAAANAAKEATEEWEKLNLARDKAINGILKYQQLAANNPEGPFNTLALESAEEYGRVLDRVEKRITSIGAKSAEVKAPTLPPEVDVGFKKAADAQEAARIATIASYNEMARWMGVIGSAATLAERYELATLKLNAAKAQGAIGDDQHTRAIAAQKDQLALSLGVADASVVVEQRVAQVREVAAKAGLSDEQTRLAVSIAQREASERYLQVQARANPLLKQGRDAAEAFGQSLGSALLQGKTLTEGLIAATAQLAQTLMSTGINDLVKGNFIEGGIKIAAAFVVNLINKAQQDAEKERKRLEDAINAKQAAAQLTAQFQGTSGSLASQLSAQAFQVNLVHGQLTAAKEFAAAKKLNEDWAAHIRLVAADFRASFRGIVDSMRDGLGNGGPFGQARSNIEQLGNQVKAFIVDVQSFGGSRFAASGQKDFNALNADIQEAIAAGRAFLLGQIAVAPELSNVAQEMGRIHGAASALHKALQDTGMSATEAAEAIQTRVNVALDALRATFTDDLTRQLNDVTGRGFLNEAADLRKQIDQMRSDSAALGGGQDSLIDRIRTARAQKIVDEAQLTGQAFQDFITQLPDLTDAVHEFNGTIESVARSIEDITNAQRSAQDRLFAAQNDATTLEGQLAALSRQHDRERQEEALAGGQALTDIVAAQQAEELRLRRDFGERALEEQRQTNERAIEEQRRAAQAQLDAINSAARSVVDYLNGLMSGPASTLSPTAVLANAQAAYNSNMGLAQGGNLDAVNKWPQLADNLEKAARAVFASAQGYQDIRSQIISQGLALPAVQQATDPVVIALRDTIDALAANTSSTGLNTTGVGSNTTAVGNNTTTVSTSVNTLGGSITSLATSTVGLDGSVTSLGTSVTNQGTSINSLGTSTTTLGGNVTSLGSNVTNQGSSISALGSSISGSNGLSSNVSSLATSVGQSGIAGSVDSLATSVGSGGLGGSVTSLATQVGDQNSGINTIANNTGGIASVAINTANTRGSVDSLGGGISSVAQNTLNTRGSVDALGNNIATTAVNTGSISTVAANTGGISSVAQNTLNTRGSVDALGGGISSVAVNTLNTRGSVDALFSGIATTAMNTGPISTVANNTGGIGSVVSNTGNLSSIATNTANTRGSVDNLGGGIASTANNTANTRGSVDALGSGGLAQIVTNTGSGGTLVTALGPGGNVVTALIGANGVVQTIGGNTVETQTTNAWLQGIYSIDTQIRSLNDNTSQQLQLLNTNFGGTSTFVPGQGTASTTVSGVTLQGAAIELLRKIAYNTARFYDSDSNTWPLLGLSAATGGLITGPGTGTSDSILTWLSNNEYVNTARDVSRLGVGFFDRIRAGETPAVAMPVPFASGVANDNSAVIAELRELRKEVARLQQIVSGSGARIAQAVVEKSDEIIDSTDRQTDELGREMRQEKRRAA